MKILALLSQESGPGVFKSRRAELLFVNSINFVFTGFREVTCGSAIKLVHVSSGARLHSHDVKYGSGQGSSGQQSVTGMMDANDSNSLWRVMGPAGETCKTGWAQISRYPDMGSSSVPCGSTFRLLHLNTKASLHSHEFVVHVCSLTQQHLLLAPLAQPGSHNLWL